MAVEETRRNISSDIGSTPVGGGTCTLEDGVVTYSGCTFDLSTGGSFYFNNSLAGSNKIFRFKNCSFYTSETVAGRLFATIEDGYTITFDNCQFGNDSHGMQTEINKSASWGGESNFMFLGGHNQAVTFKDSSFTGVSITESNTAFFEFTSGCNNSSALTIDNVSFTNVSVAGNFIERGSNIGPETGTSSENLKLINVSFSGSTISDFLFSENGGVTVSGAINTFDSNITTNTTDYTSAIDFAENTTLRFTNSTDITCQMSSCGGNMSLVFDNSAAVNFKYLGTMDGSKITSTAVNTKAGVVGEFYTFGTVDSSAHREEWLKTGDTVLLNDVSIIIGGSTSSDAYVSGTDALAKIKFRGRAQSENTAVDTIDFIGSTYFEEFGTVALGGDKTVTGNSTAYTQLDGRIYADGNTLTMETLQYSGRIYGDNTYTESASAKASNLVIGTNDNAVKFVAGTAASRIYGGANATDTVALTGSDKTITLNLNLTSDSVVGNVYGGGCLQASGSSYTIGAITTTIKGEGTFTYYVGNGTQANANCNIIQGASTLNIYGGTFNSFVYAGGYSQSSGVTITCASTALNISGGTFNSKVLGGCAAAAKVGHTDGANITGNSIVTVDTSVSTVTFADNLVAGSSGQGTIGGEAKLSFTGLGENLKFTGTGAAQGYVQGGSTGDKLRYGSPDSVTGDRILEFSNFSGNFSANMRNSFDTVSFKKSFSVTFAGTKEVDLRFVKNWEFDISERKINLVWTKTSSDTENDFSEDKLIINGSLAVSESAILMTGDATTLNGWKKFASVKIGDSTFANDNFAGDYATFGDGNYKLFVENNQLTLARLA